MKDLTCLFKPQCLQRSGLKILLLAAAFLFNIIFAVQWELVTPNIWTIITYSSGCFSVPASHQRNVKESWWNVLLISAAIAVWSSRNLRRTPTRLLENKIRCCGQNTVDSSFKLFEELAEMIMGDENLTYPSTPDEALELYSDLLDHISGII